jgi:hypothetical protein
MLHLIIDSTMKLSEVKVKFITSVLSLIFIFFYSTGLVNFIPQKLLWDIPNYIIYIIYALSLIVILHLTIVNIGVRRQAIAIGSFLFVLSFPLVLSGDFLSDIAINYFINLLTFFIVIILCLKSSRALVDMMIISVAIISALICLIDITFYDGYTNTTGRASGIFINPNIAGSSLLFLAVASTPLIPLNWKGAFIILMTGAIVSTLSRSSILIGILVLSSLLIIRSPIKYINKKSLLNCFFAFLFIVIINLTALVANKSYSVAIENSIGSLNSVYDIFNSAHSQLKSLEAGAEKSLEAGAEKSLEAGAEKSLEAGAEKSLEARTIDILENVEEVNSASFRLMKAEQALSAAIITPILGSGVYTAYQLYSHNSYFVIIVAFGFFGLIIYMIIPYLLNRISGVFGIPFLVALLGISFFSHDLFFVNSYAVIFAAGIYSLLRITQQNELIEDKLICYDNNLSVILLFFLILSPLCFLAIHQVKGMTSNHYIDEISSNKFVKLENNIYYAPLSSVQPSGVVAIDVNSSDRNFHHSIIDGIFNLSFCNNADYSDLAVVDCYYNNSAITVYNARQNFIYLDEKYIFLSNLKIHPLFKLTLLLFFAWFVVIVKLRKRFIQ